MLVYRITCTDYCPSVMTNLTFTYNIVENNLYGVFVTSLEMVCKCVQNFYFTPSVMPSICKHQQPLACLLLIMTCICIFHGFSATTWSSKANHMDQLTLSKPCHMYASFLCSQQCSVMVCGTKSYFYFI